MEQLEMWLHFLLSLAQLTHVVAVVLIGIGIFLAKMLYKALETFFVENAKQLTKWLWKPKNKKRENVDTGDEG